jgi:hypothetical protein
MRIGIFIANTDRNWGPGKLSFNTIKGFEQMGIDYVINDYGDYNFCICGDKFNRFFLKEKIENSVIGPCSLNIPSDNISAFSMYEKFLVASEWYMNNWKTYGVNNVDYWFGGIDTDIFMDNKSDTDSCFIYYKNRNREELKIVVDILNKLGIKFQILNYGSYSEQEFINVNNNSKFGIILSNTETQGFAIMESMSMNTPLFVLDKNIWQNKYDKATSVPYFSEECGMVVNESDTNFECVEYKFNEFMSKLDTYNPRQLIETKYNISMSIESLLEKLIK